MFHFYTPWKRQKTHVFRGYILKLRFSDVFRDYNTSGTLVVNDELNLDMLMLFTESPELFCKVFVSFSQIVLFSDL